MIYKVTINTVAFVEADNIEEAKETALDGYEVISETRIIDAQESSGQEMHDFIFEE